jgi:hypothetical protein
MADMPAPTPLNGAPPAPWGGEGRNPEQVEVVRGFRMYDDGSMSPIERWVKHADGDWISLDSTRSTSGDIHMDLDVRGRTRDCLPFCQGGLHEEGCAVLDAAPSPQPDPTAAAVAQERERMRTIVREFAEGQWLDAFLLGSVDDDITAVRATEAWLLGRIDGDDQ